MAPGDWWKRLGDRLQRKLEEIRSDPFLDDRVEPINGDPMIEESNHNLDQAENDIGKIRETKRR